MTQSVAKEKKKLRSAVAKLKTKFRPEQLIEWSGEIFDQIESLPQCISANNIAIYWSLPGEVFTHEFILKWYRKKTFFLPVICGSQMKFKEFTGPDQMVSGKIFGIPEPIGELYSNPCNMDLIIVPGLAFDRSHNRLGKGMAFYDKFLSGVNAFKAGVCFHFQVMDSIPATGQDIKMDCVITESIIY